MIECGVDEVGEIICQISKADGTMVSRGLYHGPSGAPTA
jgi:hypothetical protein